MATKLFLRETTNNGIGSFRDMVTTAGSSLTTGVVNTTASGTNIQWTKTAGGAVLEWISGRVPAGGFTLSGTMTFNIWASESNMSANAGGRARYYIRTAAGSETEIATSPADDGVEFGTSRAAMNWTEVPTSTAFSENDRLVVRYFITNVGTMGGGFTCTMAYDAATGGADGDSWVQINETVTFKGENQTLTPSLYTDGDTFFTPTVASAGQELTPSLYSDADTFFTPKVSFKIFPSLFTDGDTFFTEQVNLKIFPSLYADADTFYTPEVSYDQVLTPDLLVNTQQFPPEPPIDTFWQHTVAASSGTQDISPELYSDGDNFFTATLTLYLVPSLYSDADTFYAPNVIQLIKPDLYSDADTFYAPDIDFRIYPNLYTDADTFYSPTITLYLRPNLFTDADTFYSPSVIQFIKPSLFTDADSFYTATITTGGVNLSPSLYVDADTFYTHDISGAIKPSLYIDGDTFYSPSLSLKIFPGLYTDADTFYTSQINQFLGVSPDLYSDPDVFYTPSVALFDIRATGRFPYKSLTLRSHRLPISTRFRT